MALRPVFELLGQNNPMEPPCNSGAGIRVKMQLARWADCGRGQEIKTPPFAPIPSPTFSFAKFHKEKGYSINEVSNIFGENVGNRFHIWRFWSLAQISKCYYVKSCFLSACHLHLNLIYMRVGPSLSKMYQGKK